LRHRLGGRRTCGATIEKQIPVAVAPKKIALLRNVNRARPAMGVDRDEVTRRDAHFENANAFVLKHQFVMSWSGDYRIERIGPGPCICICTQADSPVPAIQYRIAFYILEEKAPSLTQ